MDAVDRYMLDLVSTVAERATCDRGYSGCIITQRGMIKSIGYVDAPRGTPTCDQVGHLLVDNHCVRTIHAEQSAIVEAARQGFSLEGAKLYCTMTPCPVCAKLIVNAGIRWVFCQKKYKQPDYAENLFTETGVNLEYREEEIEKY